MKQYIDKSAVVAEIENRLNANGAFDECFDEAWGEDKGMREAYKSILAFLDTLEAKEVNELSYDDYMSFFGIHPEFPDDWGFEEAFTFAQYFYELGLTQNLGLTRK